MFRMSVETGGAIPARFEALIKSPNEARPSRADRLSDARSRALEYIRHEGCIVAPFQKDEPLVVSQSWNCVCGLYGIPVDTACRCGASNPKR